MIGAGAGHKKQTTGYTFFSFTSANPLTIQLKVFMGLKEHAIVIKKVNSFKTNI